MIMSNIEDVVMFVFMASQKKKTKIAMGSSPNFASKILAVNWGFMK